MSRPRKFKNIDIQDLSPGMVIVRVTLQNGPIKIKKSGLVTSQEMVQGLIEMGIQQVEIDPEQTVEIDTPEQPLIKKSATQRMLESKTVTDTRIDDNLSSQFHRSLFLPTVQDMPSAWQYYGKRYAVVLVIAFGGFGFGWTLANYQNVVAVFTPPAQPLLVESSQKSTTTIIDDKAPVQEQNNSQTFAANEPALVNVHSVPNAVIEVPKVVGQTFETTQIPTPTPTPTPTPEIVPLDKGPQISEELLSKFNKAISQVSEQPEVSGPSSEDSSEGVLRIDQLPAWAMTQLPSMSFSAHMYTSEVADRWVRVNGTRMIEGDIIDRKVKILRIEPQHVILTYSGQEFSMAALTDW
jgi:general secretion pathway protein B